jgi:hypothetical protein
LFSILQQVKYPYLFLFLSFFILNFSSEAQSLSLSEEAQISILTIGPGANLYDKFGHSAFRVTDEAHQIDWTFNYGTYDFNTPNFYTKFAQGKLLYSLSVGDYDAFYQSYVAQNRWVKEQVLNLNYSEKVALFDYLINNAQPENKEYQYDFLYDNCATRIRDVLVAALPENIEYPEDYLKNPPKTFRGLIQQNVTANSWGSLGMDIAIGSVTDVQASPWEHQFLPEYVNEAAQSATLTRNGAKVPLVASSEVLFQNTPTNTTPSFFMSPFFMFGLLLLLILWVTFRDYRRNTRSRFLDATLFFTTGLIGILLLLLWLATDHTATANNYNILWAFPISIVFTIAIGRKQPKKWLFRYIVFLILLLILLCLHWLTGVQRFAIGLLPLLVALTIRYGYVVYFLKRQRNTTEN